MNNWALSRPIVALHVRNTIGTGAQRGDFARSLFACPTDEACTCRRCIYLAAHGSISLHFPLSPTIALSLSLSLSATYSPFFFLLRSVPFHPKPPPRMAGGGCKATLLVLFLVVASLATRCADGSSRSAPTRTTTTPETTGAAARRFTGYDIPRAKLFFTPSGPSEGHNSIGQEEEELAHNKQP
jgi:hypothetical protein